MVPVIPLAAGRVLGPASATPFFEDSLLYLLTTFQLSATQFPEEPKLKTVLRLTVSKGPSEERALYFFSHDETCAQSLPQQSYLLYQKTS